MTNYRYVSLSLSLSLSLLLSLSFALSLFCSLSLVCALSLSLSASETPSCKQMQNIYTLIFYPLGPHPTVERADITI